MSYSFLLEMAWKSAAISGAVLALAMLLRSRSAADRGALLRVGVVTLLLLPVVSLLLPSLIVETAAPEAAPVAARVPEPAALLAASAAPATALPDGASLAAPGSMTPMAASADLTGDWNDPGILFLLLYVGGLLMVGGRLAIGVRALARWTAEAADVECGQWQAALARAASGRGVRLLVSDEVKSPLSWGWRRPAILLDPDTLRRPDDADAILAHEVAHIVRGDWPSLICSRVAVALFWFNPLVWRLDREVAQQAEEAADSYAIARVEPTRYAQTLLDWARTSGGLVPANAMAGSEHGLARRVRALLDGRAGRRSGSVWTFAAMAACAAIAAPVAALEFVPQAPEAPELPDSVETPEGPAAPAAPEFEAADAPLATVPLAPAPPVRASLVAPSAPIAHPTPVAAPAPAAAPAPPRPPIASLQALAFAPRVPAPVIDEKAIQAEVDAAVAEAMRTSVNVRIDAERIAADAQRAADAALAGSAHGMLAGADGMERGADRMREEARRLRDRNYRERQIAKEAARGHRVTHEDLLEAAEGMEEGAQGMREGAREMRQAAREMRRRS
ncbi:M56 family metallopeptidase [Sphingosinicella sp. BN140058]|uniref:M56 family metallopeptidase n=1 Tax=Sphingosinicella sp. BN140058 TaxID=1892855 RepID=UPI001012C73E|nr:M56 family metallopeptidase [Sphingosinicella sp. BN140058]QAY78452.1 M56 family metallopeptidase [Sphingosinicella sp. BN140058]